MVPEILKMSKYLLYDADDNLATTITRLFVAFVEDNGTMSSKRYFENHVSYFVQNRRKKTLFNSFL